MKHSLAMLLAASALAGPTAAFAQDAPAESQGGLDDIIVTAQKRAEGLSDVPISISAVSGKQVESYGQTNLEQISSSVPNLKITQTAIANRIAIRGIASGDNKGFEQSVAMFVDGVYYGRDQLRACRSSIWSGSRFCEAPNRRCSARMRSQGRSISRHAARPTNSRGR